MPAQHPRFFCEYILNTDAAIRTHCRISDTSPDKTSGQVRHIIKNNEPWFVAKDVAEALGYSNPRKAIRDHCKSSVAVGGTNRSSLDPQTKIILESDIYRLVMRSDLPSAEQFQDWVVEEILPSIRQHGFYGTDQFLENALADPSNMITILKKYQEERASPPDKRDDAMDLVLRQAEKLSHAWTV